MPLKHFTTMAKKINAQNVWASVKNFFSICWLVICFSVEFLLNALTFLFYCILGLLKVLFIYNPIAFPIWVLLGYREKAAKTLFGTKDDFVGELIDAVPKALCTWEVYYFPWFMKKDFVRLYPDAFSDDDQIKLALKNPSKEFISLLKNEVVRRLWKYDNYTCNMIIIDRSHCLNADMINFLINHNASCELEERIKKDTPSAECLVRLLDFCKYYEKKEWVAQVLRIAIIKYGLSPKLINYAYSLNNENVKSVVEKALICRNQYQMLSRLTEDTPQNNALWDMFLKQNLDIWSDAQKLMRDWMFTSFYATGHNLSESAMIYFLSLEIPQREYVASIIFANEKTFSDKVMSIIRSVPEVYSVYMQSIKTA